MATQETLLSPTNVWLIGRKLADLQILNPGDTLPGGGNVPADVHDPFSKGSGTQSVNRFLGKQLEKADGQEPAFARIYGFSYAGLYYELETPALFLVHGDGADPASVAKSGGGGGNSRLAKAPENPSTTGLAGTDFQLAEGLSVWAYDKGDFSIRMDVSTGPLDQILLDLEGCDSSPGIAGSRVSGSRVAGSRVSGSRVSGSRVSGSRVSGSRVSGSRLGGGSD